MTKFVEALTFVGNKDVMNSNVILTTSNNIFIWYSNYMR